MARIALTVTVDLARQGELSTPAEWRDTLQRLLTDYAGTFRPVVQLPPKGTR